MTTSGDCFRHPNPVVDAIEAARARQQKPLEHDETHWVIAGQVVLPLAAWVAMVDDRGADG